MGNYQLHSSQNQTLNLFRLVCSILVVVIHTQAFFAFSKTWGLFFSEYVARVAVPFFFILTGYFLYERVQRERYVSSYVKRVVLFYLKWTALVVILLILFGGTAYFESVSVFFTRILLYGIIPSYWYIPSLIIGIVIVTYFFKTNKWKTLFALCLSFYLLGLAGDSYFGFAFDSPVFSIVKSYSVIFDNTRNGITFSPLFLALGGWLAYTKLHLRIKHIGLLTAGAFLLWAVEVYFLISQEIARDYNMYIMLIVVMPLLFMSLMRSKLVISDRVGQWVKEMSVGIYFLHEIILVYFWQQRMFESTFVMFVVCIIVTSVLVGLMRKLKIFRTMFML